MFESLGFPAVYECSVLDPVPAELGPVHRFRGLGIGEWSGGLTVRIEPDEGPAWTAQFEYGFDSVEKVCASPSPNHLLVVARGQGYLVQADSPEQWDYIAVNPILDIQRVPDLQILICLDFQDLVAYGPDGLMWRIEHLGLDDVEITNLFPNEIQGFARHPTRGRVPFRIDPATGEVEGGSGFAKVLTGSSARYR